MGLIGKLCCCWCAPKNNQADHPNEKDKLVRKYSPPQPIVNHVQQRSDDEEINSAPGTPESAYAVKVARGTVTETSPQKVKEEHD